MRLVNSLIGPSDTDSKNWPYCQPTLTRSLIGGPGQLATEVRAIAKLWTF